MSEIETLPTAGSWAGACADRLTGTLAEALANGGTATFAGSGGSTPAPIYARMARTDLDWSRVTTTLIDERYVPEDHPESNAALLGTTLLIERAAAAGFVPLFHASVTVDRAAAVATRELAARTDRLDAVLLGMGEDGHICSMFPHSPTLKTLLAPTLRPAIVGVPPGRDGLAPSRERLSMNLPWLMTARRVVLAITGKQKRAVFERDAAADPKITPIAALLAANVPLEVLWTESAT
ncbi:MAG: 6-phosphogluconolactonase [Alphaproteobacteria bacterium]|nr:6-phosphogluconolactonase [Alphaproteobacteria bacterium]MBU1526814.1 6-phosphogluconolactonase [Alphaproteobacteria bacterium]MBU2118238.1 6-phosphogluconolactonase [Alphaproteobacteria bacterium]MBU2351649.1 6-phosphogluconolactonase [Alphaproteobacteria bacterium]MBU2381318.1 6-phosphogluconolactonase [Alphaproteobacteria bacterium]